MKLYYRQNQQVLILLNNLFYGNGISRKKITMSKWKEKNKRPGNKFYFYIYRLLSTVTTYVGDEVANVIDSTPTDLYPLLICLIFDRGQIKVESVIQGFMSDSEVFGLLIQARDAFSSRFELPDTTGLSLTAISTENWSISPSTLIPVRNESDEFRRVANDFDGGASSIVRIDRIENTIWLMQYLNQKQMVESRIGFDESEKLLFHGCPYSAAEEILKKGFDHDRIGRNGKIKTND